MNERTMKILVSLIVTVMALVSCQTTSTSILELGDAFALASLEFDS